MATKRPATSKKKRPASSKRTAKTAPSKPASTEKQAVATTPDVTSDATETTPTVPVEGNVEHTETPVVRVINQPQPGQPAESVPSELIVTDIDNILSGKQPLDITLACQLFEKMDKLGTLLDKYATNITEKVIPNIRKTLPKEELESPEKMKQLFQELRELRTSTINLEKQMIAMDDEAPDTDGTPLRRTWCVGQHIG